MSRMERLENDGVKPHSDGREKEISENTFELSYLANQHFENRMLINRVALKLIYLFSTGSATYFLLQSIICQREKNKS